jgi:hypothetical protein
MTPKEACMGFRDQEEESMRVRERERERKESEAGETRKTISGAGVI